jgi:hypothetical protein
MIAGEAVSQRNSSGHWVLGGRLHGGGFGLGSRVGKNVFGQRFLL